MQQIESLKDSYPAWTIKTFEGYGVAILYDGDDVREDFSNAAIYCEQIGINGENHKVLVLSSKSSSMDSAFTNLVSSAPVLNVSPSDCSPEMEDKQSPIAPIIPNLWL